MRGEGGGEIGNREKENSTGLSLGAEETSSTFYHDPFAVPSISSQEN